MWDLKFSSQWRYKLGSSRLWCPEDGDSILWNVGILPQYNAEYFSLLEITIIHCTKFNLLLFDFIAVFYIRTVQKVLPVWFIYTHTTGMFSLLLLWQSFDLYVVEILSWVHYLIFFRLFHWQVWVLEWQRQYLSTLLK